MHGDEDMTTEFDKRKLLLGKRVSVMLANTVITKGKLLGFGDGGSIEILEDDGFVHYCWPALKVEEIS
jgi:hypothetical protein